ncbi:MAG TPA: hypothetical protein DCR55_11795 [Lentisphaeria bacterium]|nr:hypothetical protein [Lentisphaeria bacterium]
MFVTSNFKKRAARRAREDEFRDASSAPARHETEDRCRILDRKNALSDRMFEWYLNHQRMGWALVLSEGGHFVCAADFHSNADSESRFGGRGGPLSEDLLRS